MPVRLRFVLPSGLAALAAVATLVSASSLSCGGGDDAVHGEDGGADATAGDATDAASDADAAADAAPGLAWPWPLATYEAESGELGGGAEIVGAADASDRAVGDVGGEASHRQAVLLSASGDSISWPVAPSEAGANAVVVRFSIPDADGGGGATGTLALSVTDANGKVRDQHSLSLTSRYAWLYGGPLDGTKLYNVQTNAQSYGKPPIRPIHIYDEIQLRLGVTLQSGDTLQLSTSANASASPTVAVDFLDLETVPAAATQPAGFVSITDPACGAISLDTRQTGSVFDGADDSSYASVFTPVIGINPRNPSTYQVDEKDYYRNAPADLLQDDTATGDAGVDLGMTALADHNFASLQTCLGLVSAGTYSGVWIPPGRFYVRGFLVLPSGGILQGAGMWYSKLVAVDTAPPTAADAGDGGVAGDAGAPPAIGSVSGNLVLTSAVGGSDHVAVSGFSMFGNVTQRDTIDAVTPIAIHGQFTSSTFGGLWMEHYFIGFNMNQNADAVTLAQSRARDTFADGIDFYGSTSHSSIQSCEARGTGDDGFAMWAQGNDVDAGVSQGNSVTGSRSSLGWWGNGFAIYGGKGASLTDSVAADLLNYPCLQVSTQFVPATIAPGDTMSASASNLDLHRCGGDGFNQGYGALLLGVNAESIAGISASQVRIDSPSFKAIDVRPISVTPVTTTFQSVTLTDIEVLGGPQCAGIGAGSCGSLQLANVCACASTASAPAACAVSNGSAATFMITSNSCALASCPPL